MFKGIDLSSDTATRPSAAMRAAMAAAEVGDEQRDEDPTTRKLEERLADTLGFSDAMFFPSATMANEIAIRLLTKPGDELIAWEDCHLFIAEAGGPAVLSGVMPRPLVTPTGIFTGQDLERVYRWEKGPHFSPSRLVSVENTTNVAGGIPWTKAQLTDVVSTAKKLDLRLHMDGARFFNASVASGLKPREITAGFDMVTICLSKGLGCPVGAVLAFDKSFRTEARLLKQRFGGALRQSGILAAAGLYALDNHVDLLAEDHQNASRLAEGLLEFSFLKVENPRPSSNMVFFHYTGPKTAAALDQALEAKGVRVYHIGPTRFRAVTHRDVSAADIETTLHHIKELAREFG